MEPSLFFFLIRMDLRMYFASCVAVFWTCIFPVAVFVPMMQVYMSPQRSQAGTTVAGTEALTVRVAWRKRLS